MLRRFLICKTMLKNLSTILCAVVLTVLPVTPLGAQDLPLYKKVVKVLSSKKFQGRGYAHDGVRRAEKFLAKEYRRAGADTVMLQPFTLDINTFPGKAEMSVDGRKLKAGRDFTFREYAPGAKGEYPLYFIDTLNYDSQKIFADLAREENRGAYVVCDFWYSYKQRKDFQRLQNPDSCSNAGIIYTWREPLKFYKAYGERVMQKPNVWVMADCIEGAKSIRLNVEQKFYKDYATNNVIAKISGQRHDSCYVFTAHYDHLGNFGKKVFYAGANDNASGSAMLVTLAAHYAQHRPEFDMYFLAFSGEDAYLRGSRWFVEHPVVPLSQIRYLFNIDMVGDNNPALYCEMSDAGAWAFSLFEDVNRSGGLFQSLKRGELAEKSDHYPFAVRGVPCVFFENEEGDAFPWYHTPQDNWQHAIHTSYEPVFRLVTESIRKIDAK